MPMNWAHNCNDIQYLNQNQCCESNGYDIYERLIELSDWDEHDNASLVDRHPYPNHKGLNVKRSTFLKCYVKCRILFNLALRNVHIKHDWENWKWCVNGWISKQKETIVNWNSYKEESNSKYCLNKWNDHTSMNNELT